MGKKIGQKEIEKLFEGEIEKKKAKIVKTTAYSADKFSIPLKLQNCQKFSCTFIKHKSHRECIKYPIALWSEQYRL